ncbi:hypothetical protein STEG23_029950, partial [Scotinomys teguina]
AKNSKCGQLLTSTLLEKNESAIFRKWVLPRQLYRRKSSSEDLENVFPQFGNTG